MWIKTFSYVQHLKELITRGQSTCIYVFIKIHGTILKFYAIQYMQIISQFLNIYNSYICTGLVILGIITKFGELPNKYFLFI